MHLQFGHDSSPGPVRSQLVLATCDTHTSSPAAKMRIILACDGYGASIKDAVKQHLVDTYSDTVQVDDRGAPPPPDDLPHTPSLLPCPSLSHATSLLPPSACP